MPPCGLTPAQYALWQQDASLRAVFPGIEQNNPMHISGDFTFQTKWAEWEKEHPEIIAKANELAKNIAPTGTPTSTQIIQIQSETPLSLIALGEIADLYSKLSSAIHKYIEMHSELDGDTPESKEVVGGGSSTEGNVHRSPNGESLTSGNG